MSQSACDRGPWRFGVLFSQSGVTASIERTQLNATTLAAEEINAAGGIRGKPIELVVYDPQSNPKTFQALAEHLLGKDRVRLIFGCYVLDEIYVPLNAEAGDSAKAIREIGRTGPDVIFSTVVGRDTAVFYEAYRKAGFDSSKLPIASLTTSEAEVAERSTQVAAGHISAAPFFDVLSTTAAVDFFTAFRARFGADACVTAAA